MSIVDKMDLSVVSVLTAKRATCQCFRLKSIFPCRSASAADSRLKQANKSLLRIERNIEKIEVLFVGYILPEEERYRRFLRLCEQEIDEDLEEVENVLCALAPDGQLGKVDEGSYTKLLNRYNDVRFRLRYYIET